MYIIDILVEADAALFPYELNNIAMAEMVVEGAVGCSLEPLFATITMKEVKISTSPYTINILVEVDAALLPYELKNIEMAEMVVESVVGCSLEGLFATVTMKEVKISPSPREVERDWDALLS